MRKKGTNTGQKEGKKEALCFSALLLFCPLVAKKPHKAALKIIGQFLHKKGNEMINMKDIFNFTLNRLINY